VSRFFDSLGIGPDANVGFPFSALTLLVGRQKWNLACRKLGVGFFFDGDILTVVLHVAPVVTTTSITLSSSKIQNGDILVAANPGPPGKWPLK